MKPLPGQSNGDETLAKPLGASDQPPRFQGLSAADQCVHCGLCLPHCPTYAWHRVEGDSPRGRLTLMQGLAQGRLEPQAPRLREHLEGCLGCRSCEAVCPARVPFGALMDRAHEILEENPQEDRPATARWRQSLQASALRHESLRALGGMAARIAQKTGVQRCLRPGQRLWRTLDHTRASLAPAPRLADTVAPEHADALLFTGCMDRFFTGPDLEAALAVLNALGFRVAVPRDQVCCGALEQHGGRPQAARALQQRNAEALAGEMPVIALDSGCEATLRETPEGSQGERSMSLTRFLSDHIKAEPAPPTWRDSPVRVALHLPCTLRNVTHETRDLTALLQRLPGVTLTDVSGAPNCCGAGGTAMLALPEMSDGLGAATLDALTADAPDVIVSANVGCSVHLRALADDCGGPPILSPARFLASRLGSGPSRT
ncbi:MULTISPECIES: (Fe-S)-binding protein [unclassified Thioalkalivibrio]|uniref:(Fe-S)-binding protein n=1 Tax=unclassified Thioalkalivibrio TaxID=2621013 RepID=UPI0009DAA877|nr:MULTISPECIES: (Fe-S)-binding protein [unclassified Thioalkalivibrio]